MSRIPSFCVGLIVSQIGYVYLSDRFVQPRNRLMQHNFGGDRGRIAPYESELNAEVRKVSHFHFFAVSSCMTAVADDGGVVTWIC